MPDQMSSLMVKFFANLVPYMALLWSLDSILVFRRLYREVFYITNIVKVFPSLACIVFAIIYMLIPVRTIINNCHDDESAIAAKSYDEVMNGFLTDYDMENPITKNEGMLRKMEKRLASSDISEEERKALQQQMKSVSQGSVVDAFAQYQQQKSAMYSQMAAMAAPRMVAVQMPMMYGGGQVMQYGGGYAAYGMQQYGGYAMQTQAYANPYGYG